MPLWWQGGPVGRHGVYQQIDLTYTGRSDRTSSEKEQATTAKEPLARAQARSVFHVTHTWGAISLMHASINCQRTCAQGNHEYVHANNYTWASIHSACGMLMVLLRHAEGFALRAWFVVAIMHCSHHAAKCPSWRRHAFKQLLSTIPCI